MSGVDIRNELSCKQMKFRHTGAYLHRRSAAESCFDTRESGSGTSCTYACIVVSLYTRMRCSSPKCVCMWAWAWCLHVKKSSTVCCIVFFFTLTCGHHVHEALVYVFLLEISTLISCACGSVVIVFSNVVHAQIWCIARTCMHAVHTSQYTSITHLLCAPQTLEARYAGIFHASDIACAHMYVVKVTFREHLIYWKKILQDSATFHHTKKLQCSYSYACLCACFAKLALLIGLAVVSSN
jgi:hypothetical protein